MMDSARIAELLAPFLGINDLSAHLLEQVSAYLDRLMRWNQRMNLTAVRDPEQIVTRHFGESFFAATTLLGREDPAGKRALAGCQSPTRRPWTCVNPPKRRWRRAWRGPGRP